MAKYKVEHERDLCIGCNACASACPKYWSMEDDGKSKLKDASEQDGKEVLELTEDYDCNKEAAESCPVNCIHIIKVNDDGSEEKEI
jgi:ferredoxin